MYSVEGVGISGNGIIYEAPKSAGNNVSVNLLAMRKKFRKLQKTFFDILKNRKKSDTEMNLIN
jgi:hypothetical protein